MWLELHCTLSSPPPPLLSLSFPPSSCLPRPRQLWFWKGASNYLSQLGLSIFFWILCSGRIGSGQQPRLVVQAQRFHLPLEWLWTPQYHAGYLGQGALFLVLLSTEQFKCKWIYLYM
jgi:hypothetical protein